MGCDGGTIPKRHELVKTAKRGEQKDKDMDRAAKWNLCTISQEPLVLPIMMCELGKLYNKESILEYILDNTIPTNGTNCSHITNMKHVKQLQLTPNAGYASKASECHDQYFDTQTAKYVCPVVGLEMNGKYKFCAVWQCGCAVSERALKEVDTVNCHKCGDTFEKDDVVVINAEDDDLELMEERMRLRREKMKALRKEKKSKKGKRTADGSGQGTLSEEACTSSDGLSKKSKIENGVGGSKSSDLTNGGHVFEAPKMIPGKEEPIDNGKKASTVEKGLKHEKVNGSSSKSKGKLDPKDEKDTEGTSSKKLDPKKSSVYKKLFTSGSEQSKDQTPHWITYNPYHL